MNPKELYILNKSLFLVDLFILEREKEKIILHPRLGSVNAKYNIASNAPYKLIITDDNQNGLIKYFKTKEDCAIWLAEKCLLDSHKV